MNNLNFSSHFKRNILANRKLMISSLITAILCFGFTICNYSIGVDDPARNHYLYSTLPATMIQQGRILHVLVNFLTGTVDFIPFFNDFLGAGLFWLSSLLFCGLFQYVTDNKLSPLGCISFCCIYISYSIINEKFIYHLDVVVTMLSYCLTALSLAYAYQFIKTRKLLPYCIAVVCMMLGLGSYETFTFLYVCGVFAIFILQIVICKQPMRLKQWLIAGMLYASILVLSMILYYGAVYALQAATGQLGLFIRGNAWLGLESGYLAQFIAITRSIAKAMLNFSYLPILEFVAFAGAGFVLFLLLSLKHKSPVLLLSWLALFAGNFLIHYISGSLMYRAAQTFCFFVAFVALILIEQISFTPSLKKAIAVLSLLLVLIQSADLNRWFFNDYLRYKKDSFAIHTIATELVANHDVSKSVVFTNGYYGFFYGGFLHTHYMPGGQANGNSALYWGAGVLNGDIEVLHNFFRMEGYDFLVMPTQEQISQAGELAREMPCYPYAGYIQETADFIIVNLGQVPG